MRDLLLLLVTELAHATITSGRAKYFEMRNPVLNHVMDVLGLGKDPLGEFPKWRRDVWMKRWTLAMEAAVAEDNKGIETYPASIALSWLKSVDHEIHNCATSRVRTKNRHVANLFARRIVQGELNRDTRNPRPTRGV
jgi:hypothetical protein